MKSVAFSEVPLGGWFKERKDGTWHLKENRNSGTYQRFGTRYQPVFSDNETVFVEEAKG